LLPPRPSLGCPGTIGSSVPGSPRRSFQNDEASPLLHFDATVSVLSLRLPRPPPSHVDHGPERTVPRISFPALQHFRIRKPFFSPPFSRGRRGTFTLIPRSLTLGFGYPLDEMAWLPDPWGSLSNPNAHGLRSSEPCSSRVIGRSFRTILSAPALLGKTITTLPRCSSGLIPPRKPYPLVRSEGLARIGASCSLELSDLSGSPTAGTHVRSISILPFPSRSYEAPILRFGTPMIRRVFKRRQFGFLPLRAPACLAFPISMTLPPLKKIR
jgi:hypothetical protein